MDNMSAVSHALGASHSVPKKEIREMSVKKAANGGHVVTHKHHSPEHHPDEAHVTKNNKELAAHMMQHGGDEGGAAPDPSAAGDPAQMAAAPSPMGAPAPGGAAPAPTAQA